MVPHPWLDARRNFKILVAAGRLVEEKNFPLLIAAVQDVRRTVDVRCLILGEGVMRESLEHILTENVQLLGRVSSPEDYFCRADLFVLSSSHEGFGNVVVEALSCGLKVVATSCGGTSDILSHGKYGRLVPPNDLDALVQAIIDELATPRDPEMLKARAADFHVSKAADHYLEMIFGAPGATGRLDER